jgi:hypothetical protein
MVSPDFLAALLGVGCNRLLDGGFISGVHRATASEMG